MNAEFSDLTLTLVFCLFQWCMCSFACRVIWILSLSSSPLLQVADSRSWKGVLARAPLWWTNDHVSGCYGRYKPSDQCGRESVYLCILYVWICSECVTLVTDWPNVTCDILCCVYFEWNTAENWDCSVHEWLQHAEVVKCLSFMNVLSCITDTWKQ